MPPKRNPKPASRNNSQRAGDGKKSSSGGSSQRSKLPDTIAVKASNEPQPSPYAQKLAKEKSKGKTAVVAALAAADASGERRRSGSVALSANADALQASAEVARCYASRMREADWKNWGPYVSDRAWGSVREDYSADGAAWDYFSHDQARSRAYRWSEDGIAGWCNRFQNICMGISLWNENDPIIKERLFGVTGSEGNHGEDVKEYYFYLDSTPSHSYCKMLYKYPIDEFPYGDLVSGNQARSREEPEYELIDSLREGLYAGRYFDVSVEYSKVDDNDTLCRITATNVSGEPAPLHILPHIWYRNTWSWDDEAEKFEFEATSDSSISTFHRHLGDRYWYVRGGDGDTGELLFCENETNSERIFNYPNDHPYKKDGINNYVVGGDRKGVNPARVGSKVCSRFHKVLGPGESYEVWTRFSDAVQDTPFEGFEEMFDLRIKEADEFYNAIHDDSLSEDDRLVQRQALAGLLWSKQYYHLSTQLWLDGDPATPPPPAERYSGRNHEWTHLYANDVMSMPDKWEYPWFAAWDLAFHCIPLAMVDTEWAKRQIILLLREWYMHPSGQIPAYEWAFGDVNPPVHAFATLQVYRMEKELHGVGDRVFLERVFHKLLLNFTWWVNRKDVDGKNVFQGGFLGLDNIGVFDRSAPLPTGGHLEQSDGTAWMAMYCLNMLDIALELAADNVGYEDIATKFFEHFVYIAQAMYDMGGEGRSLWDEEDGFFYDLLNLSDGGYIPIKIRSMVGLVPLFAVCHISAETLSNLPAFARRVEWFVKYRPHLVANLPSLLPDEEGNRYLSLVDSTKLTRVLSIMLDGNEFLSDYGIRALSRIHKDNPFEFVVDGTTHRVEYEPAESKSGLFGGNSNWRGPIWMPMNYMLVESIRMHGDHYGDDLKVELPTGSGVFVSLHTVADEISRRLVTLFTRDENGRRATMGGEDLFQFDPHWKDCVLFYEYFHGDNGAGIGASHQTGWTSLVAKLMQDTKGSTCRQYL